MRDVCNGHEGKARLKWGKGAERKRRKGREGHCLVLGAHFPHRAALDGKVWLNYPNALDGKAKAGSSFPPSSEAA